MKRIDDKEALKPAEQRLDADRRKLILARFGTQLFNLGRQGLRFQQGMVDPLRHASLVGMARR